MTAPAMSPALRGYLSDYYRWATTGAPEGKPYLRSWGLCLNAPTRSIAAELAKMLRADFGFDSLYPFGGAREYIRRAKDQTQHENTKRLAWLRRVLEIEAVS